MNKLLHSKKAVALGIVFLCVVLVAALLIVLKPFSKENSEPADNDLVEESELSSVDEVQGLYGRDFEGLGSLDNNLYIEVIGKYNGLFVEDGSDEPIENALSILVRNDSDKTVQIALLTMSDGEKEYEFQITTLPAGAKALVLEKNKAVYESGKEYTVTDFSSGYFNSTTLMEDSIELTSSDGKISVKNIGEKTYEKIYIYYKTKKLSGVYMGGITYRTPVENLKPGEVQEVLAAHYKENASEIMMLESSEE